MSATAFTQIQAALLAAFTADPALASGNVHSNPARPLSAGQSTAVVIRLEASAAQEVALGTNDWTTVLAVECCARNEAAADELLQQVWGRLQTVSVAGLGVAQVALEPQIDWQRDAIDSTVVAAVIRVAVRHRTPVASLDPWS